MVKLEIAAQSIYSCQAASDGGADRIELCTALQTGGLTPGIGLLETARNLVSIPIHVLIRPRLGDFVYEDHEVNVMINSIKRVREIGGQGVVIGCMTSAGDINREQLKQLRDAAHDLDVTFHRAFDLVRNPFEALDQLKTLQFDRVLTSGQAPTALEGCELLKELVIAAGDTIKVLAGAGVNSGNITDLVTYTGCVEIHASAKKQRQHEAPADGLGITNADPANSVLWESDMLEVKAMKAALQLA